MMGRAYRLAGAVVAETGDGAYYLVGNTKQPCDWRALGFETPIEVDASKRTFVRLARAGEVTLAGPFLELGLEGEDLPRALADRFLIERNGSVSERLWRLVVGMGNPDADPPSGDAAVDARWLGAMPTAVWQIVRDTVLRCV
jgi:hypothetical protein